MKRVLMLALKLAPLLALILLWPCACLSLTEAQAVKETDKPDDPIGVATMKDDRTIILRLRARSPYGMAGEGQLVYPPTHPDYQKIFSHIGPIRPGQTVPVKPWPD
jgi:hypothetical protein